MARRKSSSPGYLDTGSKRKDPALVDNDGRIGRIHPSLFPKRTGADRADQERDRYKKRLFMALRKMNSNPHCKNGHKLNLNNSKLIDRNVSCNTCREETLQ